MTEAGAPTRRKFAEVAGVTYGLTFAIALLLAVPDLLFGAHYPGAVRSVLLTVLAIGLGGGVLGWIAFAARDLVTGRDADLRWGLLAVVAIFVVVFAAYGLLVLLT